MSDKKPVPPSLAQFALERTTPGGLYFANAGELAAAIGNVRCYDELAPELIAEQVFIDLAGPALKAHQPSACVVDERVAFEAKFPPEDGVEWNDGDQRYEAFTAFDRSRQHAVDWQNSMLEVWQARARLNAGRAVAVPDGYVMVPVEPTPAMRAAIMSGISHDHMVGNYKAMLAAAAQQKESGDE